MQLKIKAEFFTAAMEGAKSKDGGSLSHTAVKERSPESLEGDFQDDHHSSTCLLYTSDAADE